LKNGNFVLSNTCAFDTLVQIFAVAYCDSDTYSSFINEHAGKNLFYQLIKNLLKSGVTVHTYKKRAKILSDLHLGEKKVLPNNVIHLKVGESVETLACEIFKSIPSARLVINCDTCNREVWRDKIIFTHSIEVSSMEELHKKYDFKELARSMISDFEKQGVCLTQECTV